MAPGAFHGSRRLHRPDGSARACTWSSAGPATTSRPCGLSARTRAAPFSVCPACFSIWAPTLPTGWISRDVGATGAKGGVRSYSRRG